MSSSPTDHPCGGDDECYKCGKEIRIGLSSRMWLEGLYEARRDSLYLEGWAVYEDPKTLDMVFRKDK